MRRSQRLLNKFDSSCGKCSNLGGKLETTKKRATSARNKICFGSSHLQQEANADSSSAATSNFPHITHSTDILAGLGTEILSEQLPPHQETFDLTVNERQERATNSNSDTLIGNKCKRSLPIYRPSRSMEGLKRKASCSAPKEQAGGKTTKTAREGGKHWKSMFVAETTFPGEMAASTSTKPIPVQTEAAVGPTMTSAANSNTKRSCNKNRKCLAAKTDAAPKSRRGRKKLCKTSEWTLPPNFENPATKLNLKAPLRLADFQNKLKVQPMESGGGPYFDNAIDPRFMTLNSVRESLLPKIYPPHFVHQLPPEAVTSARPEHSPPWLSNMGTSCLTPELTQPHDLELAASASTTSLPESLGTFFEADDIREILNVGKALYHLNVQHVQVLAILLNLELDYLLGAIEKVLKLDSYLLETIDRAFRASATSGAAAKNDGSDGSSIVGCSQSPVQVRHFASQR